MKSFLLLSALCVVHTFALKISIEGRHNHAARAASHLVRRGPLTGSSELDNSADITYYANITLNDKSYRVLIDTGSADLWVAGAVPNAVDSGHSSGVTYAIGAVKGPIKFADMKFAGYEVDRQAYLEITPSDANPATRGLIGLGPVAGSNIWHELKKVNAGGSFLDRVFLQHRDTPNYLTTLLGRHGDPTDIFDGSITIGEVLEEYKQIESEPKLPVSIVPVREAGDQHFQILLDADAFIGPDGKVIEAKTRVDETKDKNRLTAVVDTGFSLTQVPKSIAEDIYSRISGAEFVNVTGVGNTWIVPCNQEVNLTMKIGGKEMKIHPLDVALNPERINLKGVVNSQGDECCLGTFQPMVFNTGSSPNFDIILGMSFLRNVYTLHDFGDFIAGETDKREDPYLQFLSITEPVEAHSDFVTVRLAGTDTTDTQTLAPANSRSGDSSPKNVFKDMSKMTIALIIGVICLVLAVLITVVALILRRKNRKGPVRTGNAALGKYQALQEPNQGGYGMQPVNNSQYATQGFNPEAPYGDPNYQPPSYSGPPKDGYGNPWDARH